MLKTLATVSLVAAANALLPIRSRDTCLSQTGTYTHAIRCLNGRVKVNDFSQRRCDWEADTTHRCQEECCQDTCAVQTATGASPATCAAGFALKTDYRNIPCTVATCPTVCCEKTCSHSDYAATCTTGFQKKVNAASIPCSTGDLGCDQTYCCDKTPAADNLDELRATARHDLVWCLEDSDCRKHDKGAKCLANGDCECSKDFLPFVTATGYTVDRCFPVNEDEPYTVNIIAEKPVGGCTANALAPQSALTMIAAIAANRTGGVVRSIVGICYAPPQPPVTDIPAGNRYTFTLILDYPKYLPTLTKLPMRTSKSDSRVALDAELPEWNKRLLPYTTAELAPIGGKVIDLVITGPTPCRSAAADADVVARAGNWFVEDCVTVQCPKGRRRDPTIDPYQATPCADHAAADAAPGCVTATDCHFLYKKKADRTAANTVKRDVACVANKCVDRTDLGFMKKRLSGPVQADWCQTSGQCTVGGDANATCSQNAQLGNWCDAGRVRVPAHVDPDVPAHRRDGGVAELPDRVPVGSDVPADGGRGGGPGGAGREGVRDDERDGDAVLRHHGADRVRGNADARGGEGGRVHGVHEHEVPAEQADRRARRAEGHAGAGHGRAADGRAGGGGEGPRCVGAGGPVRGPGQRAAVQRVAVVEQPVRVGLRDAGDAGPQRAVRGPGVRGGLRAAQRRVQQGDAGAGDGRAGDEVAVLGPGAGRGRRRPADGTQGGHRARRDGRRAAHRGHHRGGGDVHEEEAGGRRERTRERRRRRTRGGEPRPGRGARRPRAGGGAGGEG